MKNSTNVEAHVEYVTGLVGFTNTEDILREMDRRPIHPNQILCRAAQCGEAELIAELIQRGANPSLESRSGVPALIWAVASGDHVAVAELVRAGANFDAIYDGALGFDIWSDAEEQYITLQGTPRVLWKRLQGYALPL